MTQLFVKDIQVLQVHFIPSEDIFAMFRDDPTTGMELVQALCATSVAATALAK